ncbi:uncharacterized protein IL334_006937 [Kwoniella shivajii]|uniref:BRCA1-associated protein n=1 Tax=Kwoniella shivajii TaxID=564305 RepID=A0ABZ1D820_9TREE|nr:hypothetical protein IL334_006937 [Kwoniella shivajii]
MTTSNHTHLYSLIVALHPSEPLTTPIPGKTQDQQEQEREEDKEDWRLGEITVDWVDFTREKSVDHPTSASASTSTSASPKTKANMSSRSRSPGSGSVSQPKKKPISQSSTTTNSTTKTSKKVPPSSSSSSNDPEDLSLQPLLAHFPNQLPNSGLGPNPLDSSFASGISELGRGVVHLFRHSPPESLISKIDAHPIGEGSNSPSEGEWANEKAEGQDGSLIAILAVPAWMRPADFIEFIGGWSNCLEGVRMIREATTPNRSIVLLKFRDPLQASDFSVIFTGKAFSTLDPRETCHPIRIHHLILHKTDNATSSSISNTTIAASNTVAIPAFPPSVYSSRQKNRDELSGLLKGVTPSKGIYELPSCPVCLERLDSTITGLVTLPCAHTFDCDCLRKWGDSRCPVCRLSHLLLSSAEKSPSSTSSSSRARGRGIGVGGEITRLTKCSMCDSSENNWICVVCGTVGCGRYEPGKGHARRHWEESGHVLAMELETQRVWDYKGDNYVHRLIQSRSDGKLVELPSASSLVTPSISRPLPFGSQSQSHTHAQLQPNSQPSSVNHTPQSSIHTNYPNSNRTSIDSGPGPSSGDVEKMSTIESITLEYSYLLSSQLESMRHHYENQQSSLLSRLEKLESSNKNTQDKLKGLEQAENSKEKAELKALKAIDLSRNLQKSLESEKALSNGLSHKITSLENQYQTTQDQLKEKQNECVSLEETVRDLMFTLEAGMKVQQMGGESGEGGDLLVVQGNGKNKKKGKR